MFCVKHTLPHKWSLTFVSSLPASFTFCLIRALIVGGLSLLSLVGHGQNPPDNLQPDSVQQDLLPQDSTQPNNDVLSVDTSSSKPEAPSAETSQRSQRTSWKDLEQRNRKALAKLPGPPTPVWITLTGESLVPQSHPPEDSAIFAFWQPDQSGSPLGVVLMLHPPGQSSLWDNQLLALHQTLPSFGWATLSVELPALPRRSIPPRPKEKAQSPQESEEPQESEAPGEEQSATTSSSEIALPSSDEWDRVDQAIPARIQAAVSWLERQGHYNVVLLGEKNSAFWTLHYLTAYPSVISTAETSNLPMESTPIKGSISALILVDPESLELYPSKPLEDLLRQPSLPTLDIVRQYDWNNRAISKSRKQIAKREGYTHYVQRSLPRRAEAVTPEHQETVLSKIIRGFLNTHAKGVEMKVEGNGRKELAPYEY